MMLAAFLFVARSHAASTSMLGCLLSAACHVITLVAACELKALLAPRDLLARLAGWPQLGGMDHPASPSLSAATAATVTTVTASARQPLLQQLPNDKPLARSASCEAGMALPGGRARLGGNWVVDATAGMRAVSLSCSPTLQRSNQLPPPPLPAGRPPRGSPASRPPPPPPPQPQVLSRTRSGATGPVAAAAAAAPTEQASAVTAAAAAAAAGGPAAGVATSGAYVCEGFAAGKGSAGGGLGGGTAAGAVILPCDSVDLGELAAEVLLAETSPVAAAKAKRGAEPAAQPPQPAQPRPMWVGDGAAASPAGGVFTSAAAAAAAAVAALVEARHSGSNSLRGLPQRELTFGAQDSPRAAGACAAGEHRLASGGRAEKSVGRSRAAPPANSAAIAVAGASAAGAAAEAAVEAVGASADALSGDGPARRTGSTNEYILLASTLPGGTVREARYGTTPDEDEEYDSDLYEDDSDGCFSLVLDGGMDAGGAGAAGAGGAAIARPADASAFWRQNNAPPAPPRLEEHRPAGPVAPAARDVRRPANRAVVEAAPEMFYGCDVADLADLEDLMSLEEVEGDMPAAAEEVGPTALATAHSSRNGRPGLVLDLDLHTHLGSGVAGGGLDSSATAGDSFRAWPSPMRAPPQPPPYGEAAAGGGSRAWGAAGSAGGAPLPALAPTQAPLTTRASMPAGFAGFAGAGWEPQEGGVPLKESTLARHTAASSVANAQLSAQPHSGPQPHLAPASAGGAAAGGLQAAPSAASLELLDAFLRDAVVLACHGCSEHGRAPPPLEEHCSAGGVAVAGADGRMEPADDPWVGTCTFGGKAAAVARMRVHSARQVQAGGGAEEGRRRGLRKSISGRDAEGASRAFHHGREPSVGRLLAWQSYGIMPPPPPPPAQGQPDVPAAMWRSLPGGVGSGAAEAAPHPGLLSPSAVPCMPLSAGVASASAQPPNGCGPLEVAALQPTHSCPQAPSAGLLPHQLPQAAAAAWAEAQKQRDALPLPRLPFVSVQLSDMPYGFPLNPDDDDDTFGLDECSQRLETVGDALATRSYPSNHLPPAAATVGVPASFHERAASVERGSAPPRTSPALIEPFACQAGVALGSSPSQRRCSLQLSRAPPSRDRTISGQRLLSRLAGGGTADGSAAAAAAAPPPALAQAMASASGGGGHDAPPALSPAASIVTRLTLQSVDVPSAGMGGMGLQGGVLSGGGLCQEWWAAGTGTASEAEAGEAEAGGPVGGFLAFGLAGPFRNA